jgi:hypothetical protein
MLSGMTDGLICAAFLGSREAVQFTLDSIQKNKLRSGVGLQATTATSATTLPHPTRAFRGVGWADD